MYGMNQNGHERPLSIGSLHQVGGEGLTHPVDSNSFVIKPEGCNGAVLIDNGSRLGYEQLKRRLAERAIKVEDICTVLVTHGDWDHVSGFEMLSQESDAQLFVPTEDIDAVASGDDVLTEAVYYGEVANPLKVHGEVYDGFSMAIGNVAIRAIETPWHTPGSVCYEVEEDGVRTLITGDTLYGFLFLNRSKDIEEDILKARESIRKLYDREDDFVGFAHAVKGFRSDVKIRIKEAYRQLAPFGVSALVDKAREKGQIFINPWYKVHGQFYKY
jgi:hydroxyacylglutathione hydrolase